MSLPVFGQQMICSISLVVCLQVIQKHVFSQNIIQFFCCSKCHHSLMLSDFVPQLTNLFIVEEQDLIQDFTNMYLEFVKDC